MQEPAGWYGKLPALGDFASRRLAPGVVEPWDAWLAAGLAAWRESDPDGWLAAYLAGPSWRFVLEDGVLAAGSPLLAGVLMPSVDSVGRYFPLTLLSTSVCVGGQLLGWLTRLDDLGYGALQDDWRPEQLEAELAQLGGPPARADDDAAPPWAERLLSAARRPPQRRSWWWCGSADGAVRLIDHAGMPTASAFAALLSGGTST